MSQAKHFVVRGRVQGVGYRFFALEAAQKWGIHGYVRNLPSGDVEVHAEADEGSLSGFKDELRHGPRFARVTEVVETEMLVTGTYSSFQIRG